MNKIKTPLQNNLKRGFLYKKELLLTPKLGFFFMSKNQKLTALELHYLAMNLVGEALEKDGYEFLAINSNLKKNPQFVTLKNKETFFILVRSVNSAADLKQTQNIDMAPIITHAKKNNAKVFYAGVWLGHAIDINKSIIKGEDYSFVYNGLKEII